MNPWITKVKTYQAKHGCSYKQALIACGKNGKPKKNKQNGGNFLDSAIDFITPLPFKAALKVYKNDRKR